MSEQEEQMLVGKINAVYGIKGWVKVFSYTDPIEQILDYQPWTLKKGAKTRPFEFKQGKKHGKGIIVLADGCDDRNDAESFIGYKVWVDAKLLPKLSAGDFYWHQLEGLNVFNKFDECLGVIDHILETGANDVLVVSATDKSIDDKERLIPYVLDKVVENIDLEAGKMLVAWDADF